MSIGQFYLYLLTTCAHHPYCGIQNGKNNFSHYKVDIHAFCFSNHYSDFSWRFLSCWC